MHFVLLFLFGLCNLGFSLTTGTLTLRGTVPNSNQITVIPIGATNVNLNIITGETGKIIAEITQDSNNPTGYTLSITSLNGGVLKNGAINGPSYTISYNGEPDIVPTTTPIVIKVVSSLRSRMETTGALRITFPGMPNALAGTFSDILTFELTVN